MKRKDSRRRIRIFYGILILPTILWAFLSLIRVARVLDYDTGEKRNKHTIEEGTNLSNITSELEAVYNDRVPFRSVMLSINSTINWLTELPYTKVVEPVLIKMANASMEKKGSGVAAGGNGANGSGGAAGATDGAGNTGANGAVAADGQQVDPATGLPIDPATGYPIDPATGKPFDPVSGYPIDPPTGRPYDPVTGQFVEVDSGAGADGQGDGSAAGQTSGQTGGLEVKPAFYESPVEAGYYPYKTLAPEVIQGRDDWLFTTESYPDFTGDNIPSEEALAEKLAGMEQLNQICQSKGIQLHIVAMPNKNKVYPEYMPSVDQVPYSALNTLEDYVHANSQVSFHYFEDEILGGKVYGQLYYKHDTHWNNRGGLVAYAYIRNLLGLPAIDVASISSVDLGPYTGDLQQYTGLPEASFETENSIEMQYKMELPQQLVRGADDYVDELVTQGTERQETVVLVGDSYRHSLVPYLSRDFAHVYALNEKRMDEGMRDILNSADIIILEGVERNFFYEVHYDNAVEKMIELME